MTFSSVFFPQALQNDLELEQVKVNSLTHMVVVVDENSGESATAVLEEQLQVEDSMQDIMMNFYLLCQNDCNYEMAISESLVRAVIFFRHTNYRTHLFQL